MKAYIIMAACILLGACLALAVNAWSDDLEKPIYDHEGRRLGHIRCRSLVVETMNGEKIRIFNDGGAVDFYLGPNVEFEI